MHACAQISEDFVAMSAEASRTDVIKYASITSDEPDPIILEMDINYTPGAFGSGEMTEYVNNVCRHVINIFQDEKPKM